MAWGYILSPWAAIQTLKCIGAVPDCARYKVSCIGLVNLNVYLKWSQLVQLSGAEWQDKWLYVFTDDYVGRSTKKSSNWTIQLLFRSPAHEQLSYTPSPWPEVIFKPPPPSCWIILSVQIILLLVLSPATTTSSAFRIQWPSYTNSIFLFLSFFCQGRHFERFLRAAITYRRSLATLLSILKRMACCGRGS